jgi:dipeptidyl aminopeptidase/acylaminoacyl peptidase
MVFLRPVSQYLSIQLSNMKKVSFVLSLLFLLPMLTTGSEKIVISQWLKAGPLDVSFPAFHDVPNVEGKTFSNQNLLTFRHLDLTDYYPEARKALPWPGGQSTAWQVTGTDESGFVMLGEAPSEGQPRIAYLAAYIRAGRWMTTKLEVKSPYMLEAWLNGERIGTKTTIEKEENTIGRVNRDLKLPRGNHLLIIKALLPDEPDLDWKVSASLEISEPFTRTDLSHSLSPSNIKNISHILDGVKVTRVDPSPDGKFYAVSYSQSQPPSDQSESWTEIKRFSDNQLVHSFRHARVSRINWLPSTNALSYVSTRNGKSTVHWHHMETGEQRILMEEVDKFAGMQWSPDESFIIYSVREDGSSADDVMRHIQGMRDRLPGFRNRTFLYHYDLPTGIHTRLTYGNVSTSLQDISPDGRWLLISQNYPYYTERPYSKSDLMVLELATLKVDTIYAGQNWGVSASFSPDGRKLLATGGPSAFDGAGENLPEGMIPNNYDRQAYIYNLDASTVRSITLDFDPMVSSAYWHAADNHIYLHTNDQDYQRIYRYDVRRERFTQLDTGFDLATSMNFASKGQVMTFRGNQANSPHAFYVMNLRNQRVSLLEDTDSHNYRHVEFGQVRDWDFTTSTGVDIKGRYYLPPDFDPEAKYPVIVYYYGGTNPVGRTFGGRYPFNLWAGNGYVVYVLQPSGATGFGQEFSAAHVNNWGITVANEIIESTRGFLEAHPFTDPSRVGCAGASYGGFMTMLLMTETDMFAAAISHAGISSISSYWGTGFWGYGYSAEATAENFPWNSKEIYVGQSPLFHADKVTTPLLLITGDSDTNVPPGESIQMYTALKILDRPVELVLVKGEDHHIVTYSKRIKWHNAIMAWWDKYLKDQPQWWKEQFPEKNL